VICMMKEDARIALVHDWLRVFGGAERVLDAISSLYPDAPIYTLLYDKKKMEGLFDDRVIQESFLRRFPGFLRNRHKLLLPLLPTAIETFNFRPYDLVISSSSSFAKGIIVQPETTHVCYCHAPMRFAWDWNQEYLSEQKVGMFRKGAAVTAMNMMRLWDLAAADRVDHFVANSHTTAKRIKAYYGRDSTVIYPPVNVENFEVSHKRQGYYLVVSRLSPYKRIDIVVKAFNKLKFPLVIIGAGSEFSSLQAMASPHVKLIGFQSDEVVRNYLKYCNAFIFSAEDDFGITAVEAMASGKPVLALRRGGATETVIEGVTGEFFDAPLEELVADGIRRMRNNMDAYDPDVIRRHAEQFSRTRFLHEFAAYIEKVAPQISSH
jgi:glycosyltransferase involved in cell wall biosynthesis